MSRDRTTPHATSTQLCSSTQQSTMSTTTTTTNTTQVTLSADLAFLKTLADGLPLNPLPPPCTERDPSVPHAPNRPLKLTKEEKKVTELKHALQMCLAITQRVNCHRIN